MLKRKTQGIITSYREGSGIYSMKLSQVDLGYHNMRKSLLNDSRKLKELVNNMIRLSKEEIQELALQRANEILESWWWECVGEWADENEISDEEMDAIQNVPFKVVLIKENK